LLLVLALVGVWVGTVVYVESRGGSLEPVDGRSAGYATVSDEAVYWYTLQTYEFRGQGGHSGVGVYAAGSGDRVVRVLVLGDSYTQGVGLRDLSQQWPRQLARRAAAAHPGVRIEIVTLARGGASTYTHAEWLHAITAGDPASARITDEMFAVLRVPFDAIMVGYVQNDASYLSSAEKLNIFTPVDLEDAVDLRVEDGEIQDPNDEEYRRALDLLRTSAGERPLTALLLSGPVPKRIASRFADAGIPMIAGYPSDWDLSKYRASELDSHPNESAHRVYAERAATVLADVFATGGATRPILTAAAETVSIPYGIDASRVGQRYVFALDQDTVHAHTKCFSAFYQDGRDREGRVRYLLRCPRQGEDVLVRVDGDERVGMFAPCGRVNAPHAGVYSQVPFATTTGTSARIVVTTAMRGYTVYITGYEPGNIPTVRSLGVFDEDTEIDVEFVGGGERDRAGRTASVWKDACEGSGTVAARGRTTHMRPNLWLCAARTRREARDEAVPPTVTTDKPTRRT